MGKTENKKLLVTGKIRSTSPIIWVESHIAADSCGVTTEKGRVYLCTWSEVSSSSWSRHGVRAYNHSEKRMLAEVPADTRHDYRSPKPL